MDNFEEAYGEKCRDFLCEPVKPVLDAIAAAKARGEVLKTIKLNGNSKDLFNNRVEYMQVFALAEALHDNKHVTHLDLSYNNIDDAGVSTLSRLLKFNQSLKELDLEGNNISPEGAKKLAETLSEDNGGGAGIEFLNLNFNPIAEEGGQAMAKMLRENDMLRVLNIANTDLGMKSLVTIATALNEANRTLISLNIENPQLSSQTEEGTLHFARMLAVNDVLQHVYFGKHVMRDFGCDTLVCYGLVNNEVLTTLDLRCNKLTEDSGATLARLLAENNTITSLNVASNALRDNGAAKIAAALPHNKKLTYLDLSFNGLEEKGLLAVAEGLRFNSTLGTVRLWGNTFSPLSSKSWFDLIDEKVVGHEDPLDCDIHPYCVDDKIYVAKVDQHGPKPCNKRPLLSNVLSVF
mmetsp:Transcript_8580/g.14797  ORF Transcript_8580/g.14797 Transcript_8580/m.14797 type:complete len:406 (-) Transcript_8580:191-1408(-)|eukprot:CAMPEP_0198198328 /NCGR_PEP_ID=MMETSP1445-20131203/1811_1 /TAXON_ID=36898 /ORGANISM="Pyramimonas sp., Strain CCMP2087" /LENGTH=405 /DNA_ID=CAMNT_0043867863 /DNA_START=289 /DNA_END=1506 /DNA_ORIENTATION=+